MNLEAGDIAVADGEGSNWSGSGTAYRLRVTPEADFEGEVTVTVPAGAAEDTSGNANIGDSEGFRVDTRKPALASTDGATADGAVLTLTLDEALAATDTAGSAFAVTGGTTRSVTAVAVIGSTVRLTVDPPVLYGETDIEIAYAAPSRKALADGAGNRVDSFRDQAVANRTSRDSVSTAVDLSLDKARAREGDGAGSVTVTGTLDRAPRPGETTVSVEVGAPGDTASEGADYQTVGALTLTIPAYAASGTVRFTLRPVDDRIDEPEEALTVRGTTAVIDLNVFAADAFAIEDNDAEPSPELSVDTSAIAENGGTATATVSTGSGSTFETAQTVRLSLGGTATETADYTVDPTTLTLPAGEGTGASTVSATVTGVDDDHDDDDEIIELTGYRNGLAFGSRRTVVIDDDDDPDVTVAFRAANYRVGEGSHVDVPVDAECGAGARGVDSDRNRGRRRRRRRRLFGIAAEPVFRAERDGQDRARERCGRRRRGPGRGRRIAFRRVARPGFRGEHRRRDGGDRRSGLLLRPRRCRAWRDGGIGDGRIPRRRGGRDAAPGAGLDDAAGCPRRGRGGTGGGVPLDPRERRQPGA